MSRPKPSVAFVLQKLIPYGGERVAIDLANGLSSQVDVTVVTLDPPSTDDVILPHGVKRVALRRERGALGLWRLAGELASLFESQRFDGCIAFMTYANLATAIAKRRARHSLPVVLTEHNQTSVTIRSERAPAVMSFLVRMFYPGCDAVVGVSDAVVSDLRLRFGLRDPLISRIYNPLDVDRILSAMTALPPCPWLEPDRKHVTFVSVAAFKRAKGHSLLLDAFARLAPGPRLVLVGDGGLRPEIERQIDKLDLRERVMLAGFRTNALAYIRHADALVLPSLVEGFGLVSVEAALLDTPVIASKAGGLAELVPDIVPGFSVNVGDLDGLAAAMRTTRRRLHVSSDRSARVAQYRGMFGLPEVASRYLELFPFSPSRAL